LDKTVSLRPAVKADFLAIKGLIRKARINPTKLDWRRFTVAVFRQVISGNERSEVIGCIQLKTVPGDLVELASLVVRPDFRGQGLARMLIEHILLESPRPLYLMCRSGLGMFYEKFGFRALDPDEMPKYYRRLQRLVRTLTQLIQRNETLLVMKLG
jgi:amino-acid N-acetyltransferase